MGPNLGDKEYRWQGDYQCANEQIMERERPCRRHAAEQRDELATRSHSITSSARAKNVSGIVRRSALAAVRLTTSSNLADIADDRQSLQMGERLAQYFESLAGKFSGLNGETGRVSIRSRQ